MPRRRRARSATESWRRGRSWRRSRGGGPGGGGGGGGAAPPGEGSLSLRWLVSRRLGVEMRDRTEVLGAKRRGAQLAMDAVDVAKAAPFACADADMAGRPRGGGGGGPGR